VKSEEKIREAFRYYRKEDDYGPNLDEKTHNERLRTLAWVLNEKQVMENVEFHGEMRCPQCNVELKTMPLFNVRVCPECDERYDT
jgi:ssDNA-binding Zn-finger/Zn-ribbon topoisomerase 1